MIQMTTNNLYVSAVHPRGVQKNGFRTVTGKRKTKPVFFKTGFRTEPNRRFVTGYYS
ncbi:hypothetical protein Hanom_Chr09g00785181 [Helianthus anomalus]